MSSPLPSVGPKAGSRQTSGGIGTRAWRSQFSRSEAATPTIRAPGFGSANSAEMVEAESSSTVSTLTSIHAPNATQAELRIQALKRDMRAAGAEANRAPTTGLFKLACSTDLLFLVDTTSSMSGHIQAAKEQIKSIVRDIKVAFLNEAHVRVAVVGYKDHQDTPNIQFLDFTPSADRVRSFLNELTAAGGGDAPEDVLGGIDKALNLSWKQQTRCIIHIADAPPHGRDIHDLSEGEDNYIQPGTEPHTLEWEPLIQQLVGLNINYALLRINATTDKMAYKFFDVYAAGGAECKLHPLNRYYDEASEKIAELENEGSSKTKVLSGLMFEETHLGTTFTDLRHMVVKRVMSSASRTATRLSGSTARGSKTGLDKKQGKMKMLAITEDEDDEDEDDEDESSKLEVIPPQWDSIGWLNDTLMVEGFCPDVTVHEASTLNDMMAHDDNIHMSIMELTIHKRSRPFATGALRLASYARTEHSTNNFVVKSFKRGGKRLAHLAEDMRCQALCKAFALEFSALSGDLHAIDFITTVCLKGHTEKAPTDEEAAILSLEPYIEGKYVKYNNNSGYVNTDNPEDPFGQAAQAFSHFTFERSCGDFLVADLQGVGHVLTDPAIHTRDPRRFELADTNLGLEGFKFFFATHVCNDICRKLGLKTTAAMVMADKYDFKKSWPKMGNTVCCSSKLCEKIVRLSSAKKSEHFPGKFWCDSCWPQLQKAGFGKVKKVCGAEGPGHEFSVLENKFYWESQGKVVPWMCETHRERDVVRTRVVVGRRGKREGTICWRVGQLWARVRGKKGKNSAEKEGSVHTETGKGTETETEMTKVELMDKDLKLETVEKDLKVETVEKDVKL